MSGGFAHLTPLALLVALAAAPLAVAQDPAQQAPPAAPQEIAQEIAPDAQPEIPLPESGVLLVHAAQSFQYTSDAPDGGWCSAFSDRYGISRCEDQVTRVDSQEPCLWFVVAAWSEPRQWCGVGFGFGEFDPAAFAFIDHGPCFPDQGLELATPNWPAPFEGTAIVTTTARWEGNFVPLYYFVGYAYAPGEIPLSVEPRTQSAGFVECKEHRTFDAVGLGGLGLYREGFAVCPPAASPAPDSTTAAEPAPPAASDEPAGGEADSPGR